MTMRRVRSVLTVATGVIALQLVAPAAFACTEPEVTIQDDSAAAGDTVGFTVSNTEMGASFSLSTEGWWRSFTDNTEEPGYTGSFVFPDLGDTSKTVYIAFTGGHAEEVSEHDSQSFSSQGKAMEYVVEAPQAEPAEPRSNEGVRHGRDGVTEVDRPQQREEAVRPVRGDARREPVRPPAVAPPVVGPAPAVATVPAAGSQRAAQVETSQQERQARSEVRKSTGAADAFRIWEVTEAPAVTPHSVPAGDVDEGSFDVLALLAALATLLVLLAVAWRRRMPPAPDNVVPLFGSPQVERMDEVA